MFLTTTTEPFLVDRIFREIFNSDARSTEAAKGSIQLSVPGYTRDEIKIEATDNKLTISGERGEDSVYGRSRFSREYRLDRSVATNEIEAKLDCGVLTVTLPVSKEAQPKQIVVN